MASNPFDAAQWLARWKEAGGAWATSVIFRPRRHADDETLDRLCAELDEDRRELVRQHLKETTSACE